MAGRGGAWHANLGHARGGGASATTWALAREQRERLAAPS